MDGISRSRGWDKEIPQGVLPMEKLVLSDKWARNIFLSDCRSRGREFNPGLVPYFIEISMVILRPPADSFQEGLLSVTSESMCMKYLLTACSSLPRKKVSLGELTIPT